MKHRKSTKLEILQLLALCLTVFLCTGILQAQHDPGPRGGPKGAGGGFPTLNADEKVMFATGLNPFNEVQSVSGTIENGNGLGPTFNGNSCAQGHAEPEVGGTSAGFTSKINPRPNPQVALAKLDGATNTVPSFVNANGPVREARFISTNPANLFAPLDGGVHGLYTIAGPSDAPGCPLAQPPFPPQLAHHTLPFHLPPPPFGLPHATTPPNLP